MKKALALIMAVTFVCCVLFHGTNKVFSLEAYVTGVAEGFSDIPSFESVTECWTEESYYVPAGSTDVDGDGLPDIVHPGGDVYYEDYDGDNEILLFFSHISGFFKRLFRTIKLIVEIIVAVFKNLHVLLPWNAFVEVT